MSTFAETRVHLFGLQFHLLALTATIIILQIVLVPFSSALSHIATDGWLDWVRISHLLTVGVRSATVIFLRYLLPSALIAALWPSFWVQLQLNSLRVLSGAPYFVALVRWLWAFVSATAGSAVLQALLFPKQRASCMCDHEESASSWRVMSLLRWQGALNPSLAQPDPVPLPACPLEECTDSEYEMPALGSLVPFLAIGVTVSAAFGVSSWLHSVEEHTQPWSVAARAAMVQAAHKKLQAAKGRLQRSISILLSNSRESGRAFASQSIQTVQRVRNRQVFLAWLPKAAAAARTILEEHDNATHWCSDSDSDSSSVVSLGSQATEPLSPSPGGAAPLPTRRRVEFEASALQPSVKDTRHTSPLLRVRHRWARDLPAETPSSQAPHQMPESGAAATTGTGLLQMAEEVLSAAKVVDADWWMVPIRFLAELGRSPGSEAGSSEASWNAAVPVLLNSETRQRISDSLNAIKAGLSAHTSPRKRKRTVPVADVSGGVLSPLSMFSAESAPRPRQAKRLRLESTPPRHRQRRALARTPLSTGAAASSIGSRDTSSQQARRAALFGARGTPAAPHAASPGAFSHILSPVQAASVALSDSTRTDVVSGVFTPGSWRVGAPGLPRLSRQLSEGVDSGPRARLWGNEALDLGSERLSQTAPRSTLSPDGRQSTFGHAWTQQSPAREVLRRPRSFSADDIVALFANAAPPSPGPWHAERAETPAPQRAALAVPETHRSQQHVAPPVVPVATPRAPAVAGGAQTPAQQRQVSTDEAREVLLVWPQLNEQRAELFEVCAWHEANGGLSLLDASDASSGALAQQTAHLAACLLPLSLQERLQVIEPALQTQAVARAAVRLLSVAPVPAGSPIRTALAAALVDSNDAVQVLRRLSRGRVLPLCHTSVALIAVLVVLLLVVEGAATRLLGDTHALFAFFTLQESTSWSRTPSVLLGVASLAGSAAVVAVEFFRMVAFLAAAVTGLIAPWPAVSNSSNIVLMTTPVYWVSSFLARGWFALTHIGQQLLRRGASSRSPLSSGSSHLRSHYPHIMSDSDEQSSGVQPEGQSGDRLLQLQMTYRTAASASKAGRLQQLFVLAAFVALLLASAAPFTAVSLGMGSPALLTLMYGGAHEMAAVIARSKGAPRVSTDTCLAEATPSTSLVVVPSGSLQSSKDDPLDALFSYEGLWGAIVDGGWSSAGDEEAGCFEDSLDTGNESGMPGVAGTMLGAANAAARVMHETPTPSSRPDSWWSDSRTSAASSLNAEDAQVGQSTEAAIDVFFASSVRRALSATLAVLFLALSGLQILGQNLHPVLVRYFSSKATPMKGQPSKRSRTETI